MKITLYELLGLIKDGKAPKKIKYDGVELEYDELRKDYYKYYSKGLFEYKFAICSDFLNDEVEIIEEPKKIEKLDDNFSYRLKMKDILWNDNEVIIVNKINELIDEINNLKEK